MPALLFVSSSRCPSRASWEGGQIHFHPNVDSWASPLHTCACGGIRWPWEVVSCLDDHVTSALVVRKSYNLPRDAMHNADYTATRYMSVRLFVRLSHAGILLKRLNICSNCFAIGSHAILVIPYPTVWQYPDAPPPSPARRWQMKGIWKIAIFDQYLALSRKWYKIEPLFSLFFMLFGHVIVSAGYQSVFKRTVK